MQWWLKRVYWTEALEDASNWRQWNQLTDPPGRRSQWWRTEQRPRIGDVYPRRGPHYRVGDLIVICIARGRGCPAELVRRCPAIYEVRDAPYWNPDRVDEELTVDRWGKDGDKWAVLTPVSCAHAVNSTDAPYADDFSLELPLGNRAVFMHLADGFGESAQRVLEEREGQRGHRHSSSLGNRKPVVTSLPTDDDEIEGYEVVTQAASRKARLAERRLVHDYARHLRERGDIAHPTKIEIPGAAAPLYTDLYNASRHQLIEAKAHGSRGEIRMAIGQLADYGRYMDTPSKMAVLLPAKPNEDLMVLLAAQDVSAVWRRGVGFADNADGKFT